MSAIEPNGQPSAGGFDFNRPTIISLLYLSSFVLGITGLECARMRVQALVFR